MRRYVFQEFAFLVFCAFVRRTSASCFGPTFSDVPGSSALANSLVPLSAAKKCFQSVALDKENTIQNINAWFGSLNALYTFYNIARDAPDSSPLGA